MERENLKENLRRLRLERNYTVQKLSEKSEVSSVVINKIEAGKAKRPDIETIRKIAKGLNVNLEELIVEKINEGERENNNECRD